MNIKERLLREKDVIKNLYTQITTEEFKRELEIRVQKIINPKGEDYHRSRRKRGLDIAGSLGLIFLTSPAWMITAVAIKLDDGGSILFITERLGKDGKTFNLYKFRSMKENAQEAGPDDITTHFKSESDSRITRVGRVIRRLSVDELPQLFNVLNGEMSLVGPRPPSQSLLTAMANHPELQEVYGKYAEVFPITKPGLTGETQIRGRGKFAYDIEGFKKFILHDISTVQDASLFRDLSIILHTIPAVISGKGAF